MKNFSFKELEQCYLKATYPIEIGKKTIEKGEVVAKFDKIQIAMYFGKQRKRLI